MQGSSRDRFPRIVKAPVFHPTVEEFADALTYIESIRNQVLPYGICRITPPKNWKPEFSLNLEKCVFQTKVQDLGRLFHAKSDSYAFTRKLREAYAMEDLHFPKEKFQKLNINLGELFDFMKNKSQSEEISQSKLWENASDFIAGVPNRAFELKEIYDSIIGPVESRLCDMLERAPSEYGVDRSGISVENSKKITVCVHCKGSGFRKNMISCIYCLKSYHSFCLPGEVQSPKWMCRTCQIQNEICYGYGDGEVLSASKYKQIADEVAKDIYNKSNLNQTSSILDLENHYWDTVLSGNSAYHISYGSDVDTGSTGTGFPSEGEYVHSSWNVNNFPSSKKSVLPLLGPKKISGVMRPWLYFGMLFSTFAWHIEDHHLYSVNYLHSGSPKKWYGVSGLDSKKFEKVMKNNFPDLFSLEPDIHYHLVTMFPPNILIDAGVQVCTLEQNEGDFVITFPGAYHAGFNSGFNCAESTNFGLIDWLPYGIQALMSYRELHLNPVFNTEAIIYDIMRGTVTPKTASWCLKALSFIRQFEHHYRKHAWSSGVRDFERIDDAEDHKLKCSVCRCIVHSSYVICNCSNRVACLQHFSLLCDCPISKKTLAYRVSLEELDALELQFDEQARNYLLYNEVDQESSHVLQSKDLNPDPDSWLTSGSAEFRAKAEKWLEDAMKILQTGYTDLKRMGELVEESEVFLWSNYATNLIEKTARDFCAIINWVEEICSGQRNRQFSIPDVLRVNFSANGIKPEDAVPEIELAYINNLIQFTMTTIRDASSMGNGISSEIEELFLKCTSFAARQDKEKKKEIFLKLIELEKMMEKVKKMRSRSKYTPRNKRSSRKHLSDDPDYIYTERFGVDIEDIQDSRRNVRLSSKRRREAIL